jgi:SPASM domain peptide maturase of grasp-with-spasm system
MNTTLKYKLHANCLIVTGKANSIIVDLFLEQYYLISATVCSLVHLIIDGAKSIDQMSQILKASPNHIASALQQLSELDIIHSYPSQLNDDLFPSISTEFSHHAIVSNVIWQLGPQIDKCALSKTVAHLEELGCESILLVVDSFGSSAPVLEYFENSTCHNIELHVVNKISRPTDGSLLEFLTIVGNYVRLNKIHIWHAISSDQWIVKQCEIFTYYQPYDFKHCGAIEKGVFAPNIPHFTEAQHHNTCLNRKVAIDAEGNIRNCPSLPEVYGNIMTDDLKEVVSRPEFQKYWNIKKDEITKCKDCEFRYICTDCRAYRENPDDLYSAPLKCGYDPYTGVWEEWSTNPLKQKAIKYYGMQELVSERQQRLQKSE